MKFNMFDLIEFEIDWKAVMVFSVAEVICALITNI